MLRVATFNVNGIRAAARRGFGPWLAAGGCDVVALQEVRCPAPALPECVFGDLVLSYDSGDRAGRNGVAVLTREPPAAVRTWRTARPLARSLREFADEGRYLEVDLADRPLTVASLYLPKGGLPAHLQTAGRSREAPDGGARYARKMRFLDGLARQLTWSRRRAAADGREFLLLGDLNIAHTPLDVVAWRRQTKVEGFLPEERCWLDDLLGPRRLVDVVRRVNPETQGPYSWWSWLGDCFANDTGWRIDYHLATPGPARTAIGEGTDRPVSAAARLSDHAPVIVDYAV